MSRANPKVVGGLAALAVISTCLCPAWGQEIGPIDHRVGDANNQLGSGGYNQPTQTFVPNTANLFITGNVTGGRSFQAFSPIRDSHSLWTNLPSSGLDAFRRDSVSLDTVLLNRPPGLVSPYYSRQRTTSSLSTLSAGFEQFDALRSPDVFNVPQPTAAVTTHRFYQPFEPQLGTPSPFGTVDAGQVSLPQAELSPFVQPLSASAPLTREVGSLFGATPATQTYRPGSYTGSPAQTGTWGPAGQRLAPADATGQPRSMDLFTRWRPPEDAVRGQASRLTDPLLGRDPLTGRVLSPELEPEAPPPEADFLPEPVIPEEQTEAQAVAAALPDAAGGSGEFAVPLFMPAGADVYADMAGAYALIVAQQEQGAEVGALLAERTTLAGQYAEAVSGARRMMDEPLESFAGSADTAVQECLRQAEALVRGGQYYQARGLCARAEIMDRYNPLVLLSHGHAMLAAGEYYSAAHKISRAIELFPGIAYFKLDLTKFITEPDLLERRRADLERRLEHREDYRFRFVLGYAEYYSGLKSYGLENLEKAAELAPEEHSGIARLHHMLTLQLPDLPDRQ